MFFFFCEFGCHNLKWSIICWVFLKLVCGITKISQTNTHSQILSQKNSVFSGWVLHCCRKAAHVRWPRAKSAEEVMGKEAEPPKNGMYMSPHSTTFSPPQYFHSKSPKNSREILVIFSLAQWRRVTKCWPVVSNARLTCDKQLYFSFSSKWILDQANMEQAHKPRRNVSPKLRPTHPAPSDWHG